MNEPPKRSIFVVAGLLIGATILVAMIVMGGRVSRVLSTVGAAINTEGISGSRPESGGGGQPVTATPAPTTDGSGQVADTGAIVPTLLIVRTGAVSLQVVDLETALRDADAAVARAGGYVSGSNRSGVGGPGSATVTYRIPSASWDPTLASLHGLATKVEGEKIDTDEVSAQVVDLTARLANLRSTEAALQAIMTRAAKISDVLDVQKQLSATRGDIEKLVAEKEHLQDRAAFGSLTATFHLPPAPATPAPTPKPAKGWDPADDVARASGRLVGIGQTTTSVAIWLAIIGLPVLVGVFLLLLVSWQLYRMTRWVARRRGRFVPSEG